MQRLYSSPLRVYLAFGLFCVAGIASAFRLPISLFPESQRPAMRACIPTSLAPEAFLRSQGARIEERLRAIGGVDLRAEKLVGVYRPGEACFDVEFRWGDSPERALLETRGALSALASSLPAESRERASAWPRNESSGFFAAVFTSAKRAPEDLFKMLDPLLTPRLSALRDAPDAALWNPKQKQLIVELRPDAMASFGLLPSAVAEAVARGLESYGAGALTEGSEPISVHFPSPSQGVEGFRRMLVAPVQGRAISLGDVADVDFAVPLDGAKSFKADGAPSLVMFAATRPGGNVVAMASEALKAAREAKARLPSDVKLLPLVDPSDFVRSAIANVAKEAGLAALLAVFTLWLFVGSARNVATAALEIPMSVVMAFVFMRMTGVNLNLVSLAGLALSAGMNVDASVVVMENVFRRLRETRAREGRLAPERAGAALAAAVREVAFPVLASAAGSIVVFAPLAFTSELSYALLGDLAKAVVFSHGCSIVVALVLAPTIRLHLMKRAAARDDVGDVATIDEARSPIEGFLLRLENAYVQALASFLAKPRRQVAAALALAAMAAFLGAVVAPRLPREVIGRPSADWILIETKARGNSENRQMEAVIDDVERVVREGLGPLLAPSAGATFSQVDGPNEGWTMARVRSSSEMDQALRVLEPALPDTPFATYSIQSWNPAEFTLPDPPDFKVAIRGASPEELAEAARGVARALTDLRVFTRVSIDPDLGPAEGVFVRPRLDLLPQLGAAGAFLPTADLADLARTAIGPRYVARFENEGREAEAYMRFPESFVGSVEELAAMPIGVAGKIVPLRAIARVEREPAPAPILRENGQEAAYVWAKLAKADKALAKRARSLAADALERARAPIEAAALERGHAPPLIEESPADEELNGALRQLAIAAGLSALLLFATMAFQFGDAAMAAIVLATAPLGLIGAVGALWLFGSTLSLNSLLGVILLNGLAVANGILLLDFMNRALAEGADPVEAALETARHRLRPILMTALATALGMLPIASGLGEGGKVLQPLGLSVAGGLAFSTVATLFAVPALAAAYRKREERRRERKAAHARFNSVS